jgi:hypothetical protein
MEKTRSEAIDQARRAEGEAETWNWSERFEDFANVSRPNSASRESEILRTDQATANAAISTRTVQLRLRLRRRSE